MRMRRVESVALPAGEPVVFKPHGLHLMLFGLEAGLADGEHYTLTLRFERAPPVTLEVPIRQ